MSAHCQPHTVRLKHDIYRPVREGVEFRLIYDGPLYGAGRNETRSSHKHNIRRSFHRQLQRLWNITPNLRDWVMDAW
jgi:hypothetical protein